MLARRSASLARTPPLLFAAKNQCRCNYSSRPNHTAFRTATALPPPRIDYRGIVENVVKKSNNALNRKASLPTGAIDDVARMYTEFKRLTNTLNAKRNARSVVGERIRKSAGEGDLEAKNTALTEAAQLKLEVSELEAILAQVEHQLLTLALAIPNDTHPDSPLGPESSAITVSTHGPEPLPSNPERDHVAICRKFGLLDLESGSTVTGSSWYYLLNEAALLEIALTNYAISVALKHGFTPVVTPDVVRSDIASRCGFQPRDDSDPPMAQMYHINTPPASPELVLSGTSEIPLAGMFANKVFPSTTLPLKVVGVGHAFRAEAGARGADTRGLYRVHQFTKVELFAVTTAEGSESMVKDILNVQKTIIGSLGFPFRVLNMPTEELGASAYQKYDIEGWMPGRGNWGELSSLSNCTDYQARRLHIRYRLQHPNTSSGEEATPATTSTALPFAHTLNGTAAAIPRLIVALLENGAIYNEQGELTGIHLPAVLKPFWIGPENARGFTHWS
ncbi:Serine--tRNA ligase, chloroplastic/mitochondrial [Hypsizygus marmoreus]|uniref:serine--tRNA ligase n=1 Tax=Hypsizygus marmoreus TaxID=39966 RepID=A0A369K3U3_HYPMA|nr:Serine--tRNA ligase, chloroplastic/mitochondrial [Hypsizygus marmoreus]